MRWLAPTLSAALLIGCSYPDDLRVIAPEVGSARSVALTTRDGDDVSLTTFDLSDHASVSLTLRAPRSPTLELAVLLYGTSLEEQMIPEGDLAIPAVPESDGRRLPFERGFATEIDEDVGPWAPLGAIPTWIENVRVPYLGCEQLSVDPFTIGAEDNRLVGIASDGRRALAIMFKMGAGFSYFVVTSTSASMRALSIRPAQPRLVSAGVDGRVTIVADNPNRDRTEVWVGSVTGAFRFAGALDHRLPEPMMEVGRSPEDVEDVFLMSGLGEVVRFDGSQFSTLRAATSTEAPEGGIHGLAWVSPHSVVVFGPDRMGTVALHTITRLAPGLSVGTDIGDYPARSLAYLDGIGTLAGTNAGHVMRLTEDSWEQLGSNDAFVWGVISLGLFRGEVARGGSSGELVWRNDAETCVSVVADYSLNVMVPLDQGLLVGNGGLVGEPVLVRVR